MRHEYNVTTAHEIARPKVKYVAYISQRPETNARKLQNFCTLTDKGVQFRQANSDIDRASLCCIVKFVCYRLYSGFRNHSGKIYSVAMFSLHRHGAPKISDTMCCIRTFVGYKRNASKNNGMNLVHSVNRNSKETPFVSVACTKKADRHIKNDIRI